MNSTIFDRVLKRLRKPTARPVLAAPENPQQLINTTRNTTLATSLEIARTSAERSKGLLGRDALPPGGGLWIVPCESVHTFWMRFPLDLVYVDRSLRVKKVRNAVGPWRISACLSAHSVLELPAGIIRESRTQPGDQLQMSPADRPTAISQI